MEAFCNVYDTHYVAPRQRAFGLYVGCPLRGSFWLPARGLVQVIQSSFLKSSRGSQASRSRLR